MKFGRPEVHNAAVDIADMRAEIEHHEDGSASLRLHLTFGYAEILLDGRTFNVSARQAVLRVFCEGVEIDPSSRFGELVRSNSSKTTVTREATSKVQKEAGAGLILDASPTTQGGIASASAKAKRELQHN